MFKIRKVAYRAWPVGVILLESDAAGNVTELTQRFVAHFKPMSEADYDALAAELDKTFPPEADVTDRPMSCTLKRNAWYFSRLLVGWGDEVRDENGSPVPFSESTLKALLASPDGLAFSNALVQANNQIRCGVAPEKNSPTSVVSGGDSSAGEVSISTSAAPSPTT